MTAAAGNGVRRVTDARALSHAAAAGQRLLDGQPGLWPAGGVGSDNTSGNAGT